MLLIELLTIAHVVMHIGNKGDTHRSLKYYNFKTSKIPEKFEDVERKTHGATKSPFTPNIYIRSINW